MEELKERRAFATENSTKSNAGALVDVLTSGMQLKSTHNLSFSVALKYLKEGGRVTRAIWMGYWVYSKDCILTNVKADGKGEIIKLAAGIIIAHKADGTFATATPYQEDLLAEDWMLVS